MAGAALGLVLIVIGVVTSLVPILKFANCCACLLPIAAGLFAAKQAIDKSGSPVQIGDGAILGAVAGALGGIIYLIIGMPISYVINAAALYAQAEQLRNAGIGLPLAGAAFFVIFGIFGVIIDAVLSTVGGLIGTAVFEKRKGGGAGTPPPPPPPGGGYGGGGSAPGGGYGGSSASGSGGGYGQGV